jgi:hypothetical protein
VRIIYIHPNYLLSEALQLFLVVVNHHGSGDGPCPPRRRPAPFLLLSDPPLLRMAHDALSSSSVPVRMPPLLFRNSGAVVGGNVHTAVGRTPGGPSPPPVAVGRTDGEDEDDDDDNDGDGGPPASVTTADSGASASASAAAITPTAAAKAVAAAAMSAAPSEASKARRRRDARLRRSTDPTASAESDNNIGADDALLPFVIPGPIRDALVTEGYAVIPHVCTADECDKSVCNMWDFIEDVTLGRVRRNDPHTWYKSSSGSSSSSSSSSHNADVAQADDGDDDDDPWPSTGYKSFRDMFQSLGAGWVLADAKQHVCDRVFGPLVYGTSELHCSKEGFTFVRPPAHPTSDRPSPAPVRVCGTPQHLSTGEHYDQSNAMVGLHGIQSLLALQDQHENVDGCFLCYPKSFGQVHQQITADTYRGCAGTWFPLTDAEIQRIQSEFGCEPRRIYLNKGDVLLWRSDLVHAPQLPTAQTTRRFRAVSYCSAQPACLTPPHLLAQKLAAYKERRTGDHRVSEESWHAHRRRADNQMQPRPHYRHSPPLVTIRQAQLFGLIPYPNQSTESTYEREVQLAEMRGVRFRRDDGAATGEPTPAGAIKASTTVVPSRGPVLKCDAHLECLTLESAAPTTAPDTNPWNHPMHGSDKYLGGMASPCGTYVYGVPGGAHRVLRIRVESGTMELIGPSYEGKFKWLRGVTVPPSSITHHRNIYPLGCCVALPSNAPSILKINPATDDVYAFGESVLKDCGDTCWLYHGGNLADNGYVYAIPANANRVCKFHPATDEIQLIGPAFEGKQKWYGGIVGSDRCIYGIPHNAQGTWSFHKETKPSRHFKQLTLLSRFVRRAQDRSCDG